MEQVKHGTDTLFILLGAIMVLAMHSGFAFLELGTVRKKNQVNALVKILVDFRRLDARLLLHRLRDRLRRRLLRRRGEPGAEERLRAGQVLLPADLRGRDPGDRLRRHRRARALRPAARGDRARRRPRLPGVRGLGLGRPLRLPGLGQGDHGHEFHDFAGSVVVHAVGGWIGLAAVLLLGARSNRYRKDGAISAHPPSSIPSSRSAPGCSRSAGSASTS
jgi:Amt family ammonium transporter